MATKKQVRARVAEQRRQFEEERRLSGLQAQRIDRERRAKRQELREKAAAKAEAEKQQAKVNALVAEAKAENPNASDRKLAIAIGEKVRTGNNTPIDLTREEN